MLVLAALLTVFSWAQESFTIHRIEPKNIAVVASTKAGEINVNDEFSIETPLGVCNVTVTKVITDYFYLNTEQCQSEYLQKGTSIASTKKVVVERRELAANKEYIADDSGDQSVATDSEFMNSPFYKDFIANRLSAYLSYYTGNSLDGKISLGGGESAENFKGSNAMGFGADYKIADLPYSLSVLGGFAYNLPRSYGRYRSVGPAGAFNTQFGANPELQMVSLFADIRYQFRDDAYAVFGLNRLMTYMSSVPGEMSGDFGFHAGARYYPIEKFFVDGALNFYNMDYEYQNEKADFSLTELEVKAGYTF